MPTPTHVGCEQIGQTDFSARTGSGWGDSISNLLATRRQWQPPQPTKSRLPPPPNRCHNIRQHIQKRGNSSIAILAGLLLGMAARGPAVGAWLLTTLLLSSAIVALAQQTLP